MNDATARDGGPVKNGVQKSGVTGRSSLPARMPITSLLVCLLLVSSSAIGDSAARGDMRDFPPVRDPLSPAERQVEEVPDPPHPDEPVRTVPDAAEEQIYHLGVGDEVQVVVLGQPEFSRTVRVRPDGAITAPGAGAVHALGRSPEDVAREIEGRLKTVLRHPRVDLLVSDYGEHKVFVMGEVRIPGGQAYHNGMSAMQAIAQAGGISSTGKGGSVVVLRRSGQDEALYFQLNAGDLLKGPGRGEDMAVQPYDIVFVPRTFIADVNIFVNQYLRPMIVPFSLYLEGWNAFNIDRRGVRVIAAR